MDNPRDENQAGVLEPQPRLWKVARVTPTTTDLPLTMHVQSSCCQ